MIHKDLEFHFFPSFFFSGLINPVIGAKRACLLIGMGAVYVIAASRGIPDSDPFRFGFGNAEF